MNLEYSEAYETFRAEVRAFLRGWPLTGEEAALPAAEREALFRRRGVERGYVYRDIPRAYGGSEQEPDVLKENIIAEEYKAADAPGGIFLQGPVMLAPTLIAHATPEICARFVPPTLSGEIRWCQGYSEPGAGSDLASLQSRAELDGDAWVINGHKVWTSHAQEADYLFGLFRTEPDAGKHAGISYLLVDMRSQGIEVRPLPNMTGGVDFNEVYFSDVRTPAENIVGKRGEGWLVSKTTLMHERKMMADPDLMQRYFDALLRLAQKTQRGGAPATRDPVVRQRLSEIEGFVRAQECMNYRMVTATAKGQEIKAMLPMMMSKLFATQTLERITDLAMDLIGADGLTAPDALEMEHARMPVDTPGGWSADALFAIGNSIAGGASNVQRNIIGERALGLPRDLRGSR